ncbi:MAG: cadherin repeat domain-containing protein [Planctomycetaceae bacterium]
MTDDAGGRFAIDPNTGVVTVAGAIDREAAPSCDIIIRATSSDTSFTLLTVTISITDVNEFSTKLLFRTATRLQIPSLRMPPSAQQSALLLCNRRRCHHKPYHLHTSE